MFFDVNTGIVLISFRELVILCEDLYFHNDLSMSIPSQVKISWSYCIVKDMFLGEIYSKDQVRGYPDA